MLSFILVIHLIIAIVLIVLVLLQRSEGGGLGIGGSGDFMSGRAVGNVLSRMTAIFATIFFITSLSLALLSSSGQNSSIIDDISSDNLPQIDLDLEEDMNELPDLNTLRCFHVNGDTGITYNKNIWHHPLLVKKKQDFWVIDRINDQEDTSINLKEYHFTNNETRFITL